MSQYTRYPDPASGIKIYPSAVDFPADPGRDGVQAVAADTNTIYIYDTAIPGWKAVANPIAAIAIDALQGDVSATGPGVVNATVNSVGGSSATDVNTATVDTLAATALSTANKIVKRDANGETAVKGLSIDGVTSGSIALRAADATTSYSVKMPSAQGAASTYLQNDGSGNLSWTVIPSPYPSQGGNTDKVLATDGTSTSWNYAGLGAGSLGTNNIVLGRGKPASLTTATGLTIIGASAGSTVATGNNNVIIGLSADITAAATANAVVVGSSAKAAVKGIAIGDSANTGTGTENVTIGPSAGRSASTGVSNVLIGSNVGGALTSGNGNIYIGPTYTGVSSAAGQRNTTGGLNVGIGTGSCSFITTGGSNTAIGAWAGGGITTGSNNVFVGLFAGGDPIGSPNVSQAIGLGCGAYGRSNAFTVGSLPAYGAINTVYLGQGGHPSTTAADVKIMTMTTDSTADRDLSAGSLTLAGSQSNGSSPGGAVIIATAPAGTPGGTTPNAHVERLRVTAAGNVGIGTASPAQKLDVNGTIQGTAIKVPNYILSPQLYDAGTKAADFTLDLGANGPCQQVAINAAGPLVLTLSNPVTGGAYLLKIVQGATPGTITFPGNVKWGAAGTPTLSNTTGKIDIINLYYDGTDYYGTYALGF